MQYCRKSQSAFLRKGQQVSFGSHQNPLLLVTLDHSQNGFWLGLTGSLSKAFLCFHCTMRRLHPHLRGQYAGDNLVLRSAVNFQNGLPAGPFIYYLHTSINQRSNCPAVSAKRQILAGRRCLPSSGDHLASWCLLLRAAPVPPPPAGSAIHLVSVKHGPSSTKLNNCISSSLRVHGCFCLCECGHHS